MILVRKWAISLCTCAVMFVCTALVGSADEAPTSAPSPQVPISSPETSASAPSVPEEPSQSEGAEDIQERGLPPKISSGAVQGTLKPLPRYTAPTPSLNLVANAIQFSYPKTTVIDLRVPANLPVTVPVEISVAYSTTGRRLTQTYAPTTGTQIRYVDDIRDGLSRLVRLDIALRELVPNGKSFTFSTQYTMTPLFHITITPLKFFLYSDCDLAGKSDIYLRWTSPDDKNHNIRFKLNGGQTRDIVEFGWSANNVGLANLYEPAMRFNEEDTIGQFTPEKISLSRPLAPPVIKDFNFTLYEDYDKFCKARITYRIVLTLL